MDIRRLVLFAAFAIIVYTLWNDWQKEYPAVAPAVTVHTTSSTNALLPNVTNSTNDNPVSEKNNLESSASIDQSMPQSHRLLYVKTDVLNLTIDTLNGNIIHTTLSQYPESNEEKDKPFTLLQSDPGKRYIAESNLIIVDDEIVKNVNIPFQSERSEYSLEEGKDALVVTLRNTNSNNLTVEKIFTFKKGSYLIDISYRIKNQGDMSWKGYLNTQLLRTSPQEDKSSMFHVGSYTGASYANPGHTRYKKVSFKDMIKSNLDANVEGGWIAMQQHYFLTAYIPNVGSENRFYTRAIDGDYVIGVVSQPMIIKPEQTETISTQLYLGPELTDVLKNISPGLDLTVDYGWLWFLSGLLFSLMSLIYSVIGNWGWSIVFVTVLVKLAFYRLSATSYKSMAGMRRLTPKLQALRDRYGDDKAKISQATMELYRQEKVNPLGGCLPIVIQIPVFIALYWVLLESVQLRQAPFMLWITDLATADPYHVLPVIMGLTMLLQQRLNPAPPDPMQAKLMMCLPILFTGLFWNFPAGLVLYWIVNNSLSILQQWYITRKYGDTKSTSTFIPAKK